MIEVKIGNMFEAEVNTIINTVNCVGVMGKGIAAEFKKRFPQMFKDYAVRCKQNLVKPGVPYIYRESMFSQLIVNFPTKSHWRAASRIDDIERGMKILSENYKKWGIESIAIPPLGCGNGQLLWEAVGPIIYKYVKNWDIPVVLFAPHGTPVKQLSIEFLDKQIVNGKVASGQNVLQKINPSWVAFVEIIYRIESQKYHMSVGRTIFQKIAYVATVLGLPTDLNYVRGSYGPYCKDLDKIKSRLFNEGALVENKVGSMLRLSPGPQYLQLRSKFSEEIQNWNDLINKTTDLFLRLDTSKAEIVATVLMVQSDLQKQKDNVSEIDVLNEVMKWKQRRRPPLKEEEVAESIRNLGLLRWFDIEYSSELPLVEVF